MVKLRVGRGIGHRGAAPLLPPRWLRVFAPVWWALGGWPTGSPVGYCLTRSVAGGPEPRVRVRGRSTAAGPGGGAAPWGYWWRRRLSSHPSSRRPLQPQSPANTTISPCCSKLRIAFTGGAMWRRRPRGWYRRVIEHGGVLHGRTDAGHRARFAAAVILALATTGGCAGGEETNGLERKPAAEVQHAAVAALRDAKNVHVTGLRLGVDRAMPADLRLQDKLISVTGALTGAQFEIIKVGEDVYLKGDQAAWQAWQAPPPVEGFAGRWVKLRSGQLKLDAVSLDSLVALLTDNAWRTEVPVEQATLDGKKVVTLSRQDSSKLYVANTGPAYPVRIEDKSNESQIELSEHGVGFHIAAPTDALSNALTTGEMAWLDAVKKLSESMNNVFVNSPTYITPNSLTTLADQLRGCSSELARIGSPTNRMQPVHALAAQACALYDQGAQCFTTAANIGIPLAGSAADKKRTEAMNCGFASSEAVATLNDAINKGDEIKSQVN